MPRSCWLRQGGAWDARFDKTTKEGETLTKLLLTVVAALMLAGVPLAAKAGGNVSVGIVIGGGDGSYYRRGGYSQRDIEYILIRDGYEIDHIDRRGDSFFVRVIFGYEIFEGYIDCYNGRWLQRSRVGYRNRGGYWARGDWDRDRDWDRGRDRDRDWNRGEDRRRDWNRGRDGERDGNRGRNRDRDGERGRDWNRGYDGDRDSSGGRWRGRDRDGRR